MEAEDSFYITAPVDPEVEGNYLANLDISWTANAEEGLGFALKFIYFTTEARFDVLYVGNPTSRIEELYYFEGPGAQKPFVLESSEFLARFKTDDSKNQGAFLIEVTVVDLAGKPSANPLSTSYL